MRIVNLKTKNFRNLFSLDLKLNSGITILYGKNGQGKTNIVESIYVLSKTSSFRTNHNKELIEYQSDDAKLTALCVLKQRNITCEIDITKEGKMCFVNKIKLNRVSEYLGNINAICFSPDDVGIFKDSPGIRRHLLDRELSSLFPLYMKHLSIYHQYLEQRNSLLKQKNVFDKNLLEIIDTNMLNASYEIYKGRNWLLEKLEEILPSIYRKISGNEDEVKIQFRTFLRENNKDEYLKKGKDIYQNNLNKDLEKSFTALGIHRDDFQIYLNDRLIDVYGSQGQQRIMALSLKLSIGEIIAKTSKEEPIIILDDVFSELDEYKQKNLFDYIKNKQQVFITCTEYETVVNNNQDLHFDYIKIEHGKVVERGSK